tara:strand:- start:368 stop:1141 length:774 start_codon:yes stop_codon:yes gene_type:complete
MKQIFILILLITIIPACGSNIMSPFLNDPEESITEKIENASSIDDFNSLITEADKIISSDASNEEKANAYLIKAEAILGKSEITPLDIIAKIATTVEENDNPLNLLDTAAPIEDLLAASYSLTEATRLGNSGSDDQQLLKGIVNTMIVVNTITTTFEIDENGNSTLKSGDNYSDALEEIMYPDNTNKTPSSNIFHYSQEAVNGFVNSNALTDEQEDESEKIRSEIEKVNDLYTDLENKDEGTVKSELEAIFENFGNQ